MEQQWNPPTTYNPKDQLNNNCNKKQTKCSKPLFDTHIIKLVIGLKFSTIHTELVIERELDTERTKKGHNTRRTE